MLEVLAKCLTFHRMIATEAEQKKESQPHQQVRCFVENFIVVRKLKLFGYIKIFFHDQYGF